MWPPIKNLLLKSGLVALLVGMWLIFSPAEMAHADELTVQVSSSDTSTVTITPSSTVIIQQAEASIAQAESTTAQIVSSAAAITGSTETITATITQAQTSITQAQAVVDSATVAMAQVDSATVLVAEAEENVAIAQIAVDSQTAVVTTQVQLVDSATAVVTANTTPGLNMTVYSNPGTNAAPDMGGTVVFTGTDTNGINEQWGSSGPTVNGANTTITETFSGNQLNTNIGITVNGTPVSTTNNSGVYIGSIGFPGPGQDPSLSFYTPTQTTTIAMPSGTTSAGFDIFAKNGNTTGLITYTDGTTETYVLQHNVSPEYVNYVHRETFTAPAGKTIATVTIPTDWDYFAIDNVSATKPTSTTVIEDFQVKWEGIWTPQYTGTQYITAPADDGVRLYLDNQLVIDDWYDKGGGGSTADVETTAGVSKQFKMWYYENGGGANVSLLRYTGSGWEVIPASEFSTTTATPQQLQAVATAQNNLNLAQETLNILESDLTTAEEDLVEAEGNLEEAQNELESAIIAVGVAVVNMNASVSAAQAEVNNTLAQEEAARQAAAAAEAARLAAEAAEAMRVAAAQAYAAEQSRIAAEAAAARAQAEAAKAEADRLAAEEAAAQAEAEAQQAEAERVAAEEAAAKAEEEARAQEEANAKAEAERLEAEAEAARQAEEQAKAEAEAAEAEAEAARQAEEDAKAEAEAKEKELEEAKAEEEKAKVEEEKLEEILEEAKDGKELTEEQKEVVVEALIEDLKPGESISAAEIKASGVSYADLPPSTPVELRTDENGNALVITAAVAANIELVQDPGALLEAALTDPGAALAALGSIGADMTEAEREEATDMVVATVVAAGAAINAAAVATGGATGGSTGGGGSSGGGSGANSPGSRGGRKW